MEGEGRKRGHPTFANRLLLLELRYLNMTLYSVNHKKVVPPNSSDLNPADYAIWSIIQLNAAGNILTVHYKI